MRSAATPVLKLLRKVDGAVERETAIVVDVDVQSLVVGGDVDNTDITPLDEVIGDQEVFLIRCDLHVVGADGWLFLIWVIEPFDVIQVADVESRDVIPLSDGEVGKSSILADVGARLWSARLYIGFEDSRLALTR